MRKTPLYVLALIGLAVAGNWALGFFGGQQAAEGSAERPAQSLHAIRLSQQLVTSYEWLPGRVVAFKSAEIRPQVSGIITERLFKEGSAVKEGQQLYQVDPASYQAAYDSAQADLQKARANVKSIKAKNERYKELVKIDAVSKQEYDDIQASLAQANADIAIASAAIAQTKINLNYTKVYAPISGTIGKSNITKGALVTAGQAAALATITALNPIYVDMTQSSADLMRLRESAKDYENIPVTLFIGEGARPYAQLGKLQFHEVTVDQTTGSVQLRALFPNPNKILLPGLFVRSRLSIEKPQSLLVPQNAATRQPDGSLSVWRLGDSGAVQPATITTSGTVGSNWIVSSGVEAGDVIVIEGLIGLAAGTKIIPVFEEKEADRETPQTDSKE